MNDQAFSPPNAVAVSTNGLPSVGAGIAMNLGTASLTPRHPGCLRMPGAVNGSWQAKSLLGKTESCIRLGDSADDGSRELATSPPNAFDGIGKAILLHFDTETLNTRDKRVW